MYFDHIYSSPPTSQIHFCFLTPKTSCSLKKLTHWPQCVLSMWSLVRNHPQEGSTPPRSHDLKESWLFLPYQLFTDPQTEVEVHEPFAHHSRTLLAWSCASNHNCCELAVRWSCQWYRVLSILCSALIFPFQSVFCNMDDISFLCT